MFPFVAEGSFGFSDDGWARPWSYLPFSRWETLFHLSSYCYFVCFSFFLICLVSIQNDGFYCDIFNTYIALVFSHLPLPITPLLLHTDSLIPLKWQITSSSITYTYVHTYVFNLDDFLALIVPFLLSCGTHVCTYIFIPHMKENVTLWIWVWFSLINTTISSLIHSLKTT